jgi:hypothetical protein
MPPKSLFASKTFWVNALTLAIGVGGYLTGLVPAPYQPIVVAALALANIILRTITDQPVTITGAK